MTWKKAVFLGGAVLLLAACSDTISPRPNPGLQKTSSSANLFLKKYQATTLDESDGATTTCRSGYYVRGGTPSDSTSSCTEQ